MTGKIVRMAESDSGVKPVELGDLLVSYLEQLGVEFVFGIPGGAIEPFVDALARSGRRGGPRLIISRHENGAAFMADGYSSVTGKLGVCFATTGPGTTNVVTGVASAYANNIPMLVITAQTSLDTFGKGAFQESSCTGINTLSIFESITRYNSLVSHPEQFEAKLAAAIMSAYQSPRGPAHLSIPIDVMKTPPRQQLQFENLPHHVEKPALLDQAAFEEFSELLLASRKPVFVIGNEAGEAIGTILEIAVWLNVPVIVTPYGKGLISPHHPLFRGVIGFAGHQSTVDTLTDPDVDLVVAIGTTLGEWASEGWNAEVLLNSRLVHVESSENRFIGSPMARLHVRGSIQVVFDQLKQKMNELEHPKKLNEDHVRQVSERKEFHFTLDDEEAFRSEQVPIMPQRLMAELPAMFPPHTRYLADTGNSFGWAMHYLHPYDRRVAGKRDAKGGLFKASLEFASMGWAIGSCVGMALALPGTPVVCITGDGSYLMSGQEITVAIQEELPIIFIVLNDAGYGMVKHGQRLTGAEPAGYSLPEIDFAAMAAAMGIEGHVINSVQDLKDLDIRALCKKRGPTMLDVRIDPEATPPIGLRTRVLRRNNAKKA
jgi:acetolactate synthase-1/2/3 large subunit